MTHTDGNRALGAWFSSELSRTVPLLARLFVGHATILPLLFELSPFIPAK